MWGTDLLVTTYPELRPAAGEARAEPPGMMSGALHRSARGASPGADPKLCVRVCRPVLAPSSPAPSRDGSG